MSEDQRSFFNRHAAGWDADMNPAKLAHVEKIVADFKIRPGDDILDIGSGTGIMLPMLRRHAGAGTRITAIDISENMLDEARRKNGDGFTYERTAAEDMTFDGHSFDLAVCYQVFPHFYDKTRALSNIRRVLRDRGRLVIAHGLSRDGINNLHRDVGGIVAEDRIPDEKTMRAILTGAGFGDVMIRDAADHYLVSAQRTKVSR